MKSCWFLVRWCCCVSGDISTLTDVMRSSRVSLCVLSSSNRQIICSNIWHFNCFLMIIHTSVSANIKASFICPLYLIVREGCRGCGIHDCTGPFTSLWTPQFTVEELPCSTKNKDTQIVSNIPLHQWTVQPPTDPWLTSQHLPCCHLLPAVPQIWLAGGAN